MHTNSASYTGNVRKYYVYTILKGLNFGLFTAIWVIFLQERHGLSLTQVTLVDVAFWIAATLGEVPTGIVADSYGRKKSLVVGVALMGGSVLAWALAPTVPLVALSYVAIAIGATFLSGAEEALVFESLKISGRVGDYTRIAGRISAMTLAATAVGNLSSGLLASVDLRLPFFMGAFLLLSMLGIVLTFKEPQSEEDSGEQKRDTYWAILRQALALMRARPTLRYAILYLTLIPITAVAMETVFLQPQAVVLGVPLAGIGFVVMAVQLSSMAGATSSHRVREVIWEARVMRLLPFGLAASLLLLGLFQTLPALAFAAAISFFTAILRPIVMNRIQGEVSDNIRATVLSVQSLLFAFVIAFIEPLLGAIADRSGFPATYFTMAGGLTLLVLLLFWRSRDRFP
jgi:MFS family permease